jgi:hypothetical protein
MSIVCANALKSNGDRGWVPRARPLVRVVSPALSLCPPSSSPVGVPTVPTTVSWGSWLSAWSLGSAVGMQQLRHGVESVACRGGSGSGWGSGRGRARREREGVRSGRGRIRSGGRVRRGVWSGSEIGPGRVGSGQRVAPGARRWGDSEEGWPRVIAGSSQSGRIWTVASGAGASKPLNGLRVDQREVEQETTIAKWSTDVPPVPWSRRVHESGSRPLAAWVALLEVVDALMGAS